MQMKRKRILILDDEEDILAGLSDVLLEEGYEIEGATNANSILEQFTLGGGRDFLPFDLCLLDFQMPAMDGLDFFREIRKIQFDLKTIVMTADTNLARVQMAKSEGVAMVMQKPVDVPPLLNKIETMLSWCDEFNWERTDWLLWDTALC